jgi:hypothetical protein
METPDRHQLSPYWNRTEVIYWVASAIIVIAYAVAVGVFDAESYPWDWFR